MDFITFGQTILSLLNYASNNWKTTTAPNKSTTVPHPSQAIKDLQALLNKVLNLNPTLIEDGWLGPKTETAIEQGITLIRTTLGIV